MAGKRISAPFLFPEKKSVRLFNEQFLSLFIIPFLLNHANLSQTTPKKISDCISREREGLNSCPDLSRMHRFLSISVRGLEKLSPLISSEAGFPGSPFFACLVYRVWFLVKKHHLPTFFLSCFSGTPLALILTIFVEL